MRVLHVIPAVAFRYGGPSVAVVSMCRALMGAGVDVLVASTDADGPRRLDVPVGEQTTWQGVPAILFARDFSESFKYSAGLAAWLRTHVREFQAVHIHAVLSHAPIAAAAACRRAGVPYIVRPLGTLAPWSLGRKALRKRLLLALGARRALGGAAAIHYTSAQERDEVERTLGLARGVVIPLGIDPALLAAPLVPAAERARDRYVLVVSRLHPKKNLEVLIESFVACRAGRSQWNLVIAGAGDDGYVRSLTRLVEARGAVECVRFAGWVDGDVKRALIQRASLFALPSRHENFGMSVLEALAAGVPALVSRGVHLADAIDRARAGWVVDADEPSLRSGLAEALGDAAECEQRALRARELARTFAWPGITTKLTQLYADVQRAEHERRSSTVMSSALSAPTTHGRGRM